jgi:ribosomal protein S18 acetylase RimI-like enzyme
VITRVQVHATGKIELAVGTSGDVEPFVELLESAATWLWERGVRQWEPGSMRDQQRLLRAWADAGHLVAARADDLLVAGCFLVPHPTAEWSARPGDALYLHKLVVARTHARRGLAHRILSWCEHDARSRGVPRIRLDCWDGNERLRSLYRAEGYRELEAVPSFGYSVRLFEREVF